MNDKLKEMIKKIESHTKKIVKKNIHRILL